MQLRHKIVWPGHVPIKLTPIFSVLKYTACSVIFLIFTLVAQAAEKYNGWYVAQYKGECFDVFVDNQRARFTGDIGRMTMKNRLSCSGTGSANSISGTWREKTHPTSGECYLELTVIPPRRNIRSGHYLAIADYHEGCDKGD